VKWLSHPTLKGSASPSGFAVSGHWAYVITEREKEGRDKMGGVPEEVRGARGDVR
jgi:hypothetical protein